MKINLQLSKFFDSVVGIVLSVLLCCASFSTNSYAVTDKIIAYVNDQVITQSELHTRVIAVQQHLSQMEGAPSKASIRQKVLDDLIDRELQLQLAKRNGIQVPEAAVDNAIAGIAKRNGITVELMKQELQKQNVKFSDFRKQIRDDMTISIVVQQALMPKVRITDEEVERALKSGAALQQQAPRPTAPAQYHIVDVLIPTAEHADSNTIADAKKAAVIIAARLRKGAALADATQGISVVGGDVQHDDLGWRMTKDLPSIFVAEVSRFNAPGITEPIVAPNGIHIVKIVELNKPMMAQPQPEKPTRNSAREYVFHNKISKLIKPWLQQMRATAYIKIVE
jgi:peptidyl-prolyl cis-trans isomerase SurA